MPRGSGTRVPPSLPIAHQTHTHTHTGLQMDASPTLAFRTPKTPPQAPVCFSPRHKQSPFCFPCTCSTAFRLFGGALIIISPLYSLNFFFTEENAALRSSPHHPQSPPNHHLPHFSPCLSPMPNLSLCHFNYSPGNLYGGILQEHQSAKKVISRPATQLWYQ